MILYFKESVSFFLAFQKVERCNFLTNMINHLFFCFQMFIMKTTLNQKILNQNLETQSTRHDSSQNL